MTSATSAAPLLIIIPAFNEEGAVGSVVKEVRQVMPGVPILVIDDASRDATRDKAREAGARVLPLPHHLGLGGCVQAGYRLAFELGFQYVIRVDGDGQHDPAGGEPAWLCRPERAGVEGGDAARRDTGDRIPGVGAQHDAGRDDVRDQRRLRRFRAE